MKKIVILCLSLGALFLVMWGAAAEDEPAYLIIAHAENPATTLTKSQVSKFLLKKVSKWEDGTQAEPVDQAVSEEVRKAFSKEILRRSISGIKSYWQRQVFTGENVPPLEVNGDREVVDFVKSRPGGIGYVSRDAALAGVKVLTITD